VLSRPSPGWSGSVIVPPSPGRYLNVAKICYLVLVWNVQRSHLKSRF
jgi:hypothetical protein